MKIQVFNIYLQYFFVYFVVIFSILNKISINIAFAQNESFSSSIQEKINSTSGNNNFRALDVIEQVMRLNNSKSSNLEGFLNEIDLSENVVIYLSCKPGGIQANSTLALQHNTSFQPARNLFNEQAVWQDMRLKIPIKNKDFMQSHQRLIKYLQKSDSRSSYPQRMQATNWLKTKDDQIRLTGGIPVTSFRGGIITPKTCQG